MGHPSCAVPMTRGFFLLPFSQTVLRLWWKPHSDCQFSGSRCKDVFPSGRSIWSTSVAGSVIPRSSQCSHKAWRDSWMGLSFSRHTLDCRKRLSGLSRLYASACSVRLRCQVLKVVLNPLLIPLYVLPQMVRAKVRNQIE